MVLVRGTFRVFERLVLGYVAEGYPREVLTGVVWPYLVEMKARP